MEAKRGGGQLRLGLQRPPSAAICGCLFTDGRTTTVRQPVGELA